jgi:hypothetical protein
MHAKKNAYSDQHNKVWLKTTKVVFLRMFKKYVLLEKKKKN